MACAGLHMREGNKVQRVFRQMSLMPRSFVKKWSIGLKQTAVKCSRQYILMNTDGAFIFMEYNMLKFLIVPHQQKNGKIVNRLFWSDDGINWYWVGGRKPYV